MQALVWVLRDEARAERFMTLTGLSADDLRAGVGSRGVQGAVLAFLANHEPDMLAAAAALDVPPAELAAAGRLLGA